MLHAHDNVPQFEVTTADGSRVRYRDIWQHRNLLLVCVEETQDAGEWRRWLSAIDCRRLETSCIVTAERVNGVPRPGLIVADRWGEIHDVAAIGPGGQLPDARAVVEWLEFIEHRCPECEGEAR